MSKCKDCFHYDVCSGFTPTDLDADVFDYCREGRADEIPDIEKRCNGFKHKADVVEVRRGHWIEERCNHKPYRLNHPEKWVKYKCSECGYGNGRKHSYYCPNCGTKMDGEENTDE